MNILRSGKKKSKYPNSFTMTDIVDITNQPWTGGIEISADLSVTKDSKKQSIVKIRLDEEDVVNAALGLLSGYKESKNRLTEDNNNLYNQLACMQEKINTMESEECQQVLPLQFAESAQQ